MKKITIMLISLFAISFCLNNAVFVIGNVSVFQSMVTFIGEKASDRAGKQAKEILCCVVI